MEQINLYQLSFFIITRPKHLYRLLLMVFILVSNVAFVSISHALDFGGTAITGGGPAGPPGPPPGPPGPPEPPEPPESPEDEKDDNNGGSPPAVDCEDEGKGKDGKTPDSVHLFSGYESFKRTDITVKGLNTIRLVRTYNSQSTYDSTLGYGWSFNYDQRLFEYPDQSVVIRYGCGQKDRFIYTANTYQTPVDGLNGKLESIAAGEFVYTHRNGLKDYYDTQGRFTAREYLLGHRLEFSYDSRGKLPLTGSSQFSVDPGKPMVVARHYRLTKIRERLVDGTLTNNSLTFVYDENTGRLQSVTSGLETSTLNDDRQIVYIHDTTDGLTLGNLETVNGLEGHISTYIYNDLRTANFIKDKHNITTIQEGVAAIPYVFTYDEDDRVITQIHGNTSRVFNYVVNNQNSTVSKTVKDDQGVALYTTEDEYWFDPVTEKVSAYEDGVGNRFEYDYDAFTNPSQTRIFHNQGTVAVPSLALQKTIDYTYDAEGNKLTEVVALDDVGSGVEVVTKTWTYDNGWVASEQVVSDLAPSKTFRTEYTFYKDGNSIPTNIMEEKRFNDTTGTFQTTTFTYDVQNRLATETFQDGHKKVYSYENSSQYVTKIHHEIGGIESLYDVVRFGYDAQGNINNIQDAGNNNTQLVYDDRGRLTNAINALNEEIIYSYVNDRLQQIELGKTAVDGEGQIIKLNYNANNRLENIQGKNNSGIFITQVSYTYDSEGRKLTESDGENNTTQFEYDLAGNLSKVIDPLLKETAFKYDATNRIISVIDANLNETKYTYDDLGRRNQVEQLGVMPTVITRFTYNAAGDLVSVIDGKGQTTQYVYDSLSRKISETKQLTPAIQYFYDNRNRLDYVLNARGQKIDHIYEEWGPIKTINYYEDGATTTIDRTISVQYDNVGTVDNITDTGISPGPMYNYTYDALNRRDITTVNAYPGSSITMDDDYDRFGNRNKLTLTDGSGSYVHDYSFNKLNQLITAALPGSQLFSNINYYDDNTLKQLTTPSSIVADYLYEPNGPMKDIKFTDNVTTSIIDQYIYTFDNVRNVDTVDDNAGSHDYNYDGLYRLTQAIRPTGPDIPASEDYIYDAAGNREDPGDSLLYNYDANNRITNSPSVANYSYDNDGNTTGRMVGEILTYNHDNRLTDFSDGTVNANYKYDPAGRRINKTVDGITTWYLWDDSDLLAEYDNSGGQMKRYAYLPNQVAPVQLAVDTSIYDIHSDYLQTPKRLTDSNRNTIWQAHYESFGNVKLAVNSVEFNLRFPGQYYDSESGLHYNYFRYYDSDTGRYYQAEPLGVSEIISRYGIELFNSGDTNSYTYSLNNPINLNDPNGETWQLGVVVAIVATYTANWYYWNVINTEPFSEPPPRPPEPPKKPLECDSRWPNSTPVAENSTNDPLGNIPNDQGGWPDPRLPRPILPPASMPRPSGPATQGIRR